MKTKYRLLPLLVITLALAAAISMQAVPTVRSDSPKNNILARALDIELGNAQPRPEQCCLPASSMTWRVRRT
jgi:hypothetical protein